MKGVLKILLGAFLFFMLAAAIEEWDTVVRPFLPRSPPPPGQSAGGDTAGAIDAVRVFNAVARHLYSSGGDRRFAQRLPASDEVGQEMLADIAYLQHSLRRQDAVLLSLEVVDARELGEGLVEVRTREHWVFRLADLLDGGLLAPVRAQEVQVKYMVRREGSSWRIHAWQLADGERSG
ncbi:MAG: hypothetical protein HYZ28_26075 [Myxococcales bacterium]|nr:hypothetical protein [Myxococcales bacterium]